MVWGGGRWTFPAAGRPVDGLGATACDAANRSNLRCEVEQSPRLSALEDQIMRGRTAAAENGVRLRPLPAGLHDANAGPSDPVIS